MSAARRGVLAGCALGVSSGWNIGNIGAVASDLAHSYHVALATIGLLTTALFVTHAATQIPGGKASDRFGPRRTGVAALCFIAIGDLVALTAPHPALAIAGRAVTGIGTGLAFISGTALVRESGGSPFAQGVFGGVGLGIAGIALAVMPLAEDRLGWRAPYATSIALATCAGAVVLALAPRGGRPARGAVARAAGGRVLGDRRLYRLAVVYSVSYGFAVVLGNWVVELLERHSSLSDGAAAVVGGLTLLLGIVTRPLGGWIMRAHPRRVRRALALSLAAGGAGTFALVTAQPAAVAVAGGLLVGAAAGIPFAPAFNGAASTRPDAPAASVGFVNGIANTVVLVGTPLVGLTFSIRGEGRIGFAVVGLLWLGALAAVPRRRELGLR